jgi:hypothetical protein
MVISSAANANYPMDSWLRLKRLADDLKKNERGFI